MSAEESAKAGQGQSPPELQADAASQHPGAITDETKATTNNVSQLGQTTEQFEDTGVSNGDVDWLFRGKAVKKLTRKRTNTIANDVQNQQIQLKAAAAAAAAAASANAPPTDAIEAGMPSTSTSSNKDQVSIAPNQVDFNASSPVYTSSINDRQSAAQPSTTANSSASASTGINSQWPSKLPTLPDKKDTIQQALPRRSSLKASSVSSTNQTELKRGSSLGSKPTTLKSSPLQKQTHRSVSETTHPTSSGTSLSTPESVLLGHGPVTETPQKRASLFSSLSSKFKQAPAQQSPVQAPASTQSQDANHSTSIPALSINTSKKASVLSSSPSESKSGFLGIRKKLAKSPHTSTPPSIPATTATTHINPNVQATFPLHNNNAVPGSPSITSTGETITPVSSINSSVSTNIPLRDRHVENKKKLDKIPFKRVAFALDILPEDPQQQIPSRRPKKGNILIPEDLTSAPARLSIGITDSFNNQTKNVKPDVDPTLLKIATDRQKLALIESRKHAEEAYLSALRIAKEVSSFKKHSLMSKDKDYDDYNEPDFRDFHESARDVAIDTPLHDHIDYFGTTDVAPEDEQTNVEHDNTTQLEDLPLDLLYTRCCHLREILPIPATLKQLKNKTRPLQVLKMLNPKPTLIDILSFSDFLTITPIVTVIFDNVTLDNQMLKIILISLSNSTTLEKLSFRNVAMNAEGWAYLCKFLTVNKSLIKLDISQQKVKSEISNAFLRSEMDWDFFTESIVMRGGLEELVINGCKLTTEQFKNLVKNGLMLTTKRFGVASTLIDRPKTQVLADWISRPNNMCIGIDIGFNDLDLDKLTPFIEVFDDPEKKKHIKLAFFSLNSTKIAVEDCSRFVQSLSKVPSTRFFDLGNNPQLFPGVLPSLGEYLPQFEDLRRLHFEFDELSEASIVRLCSIFPKCPKLIHVSLLGNNNINYSTAASLYSSIRYSNIYNLDVDYDLISDELSSKIAFYLMKNMERFINKDLSVLNVDDEDLIFDGSVLTKTAEKLLESDKDTNEEEKQLIFDALLDKTTTLRHEIHHTMDNLFAQRDEGKLTFEGKETLLRFCLLDNSLESIFHIFTEQQQELQQKQVQRKLEEEAELAKKQEEELKQLQLSKPPLLRKHSNSVPMHRDSSDMVLSGPIVSPVQTMSTSSSYFSPLISLQNAIGLNQPNSEDRPHQVVVDISSNEAVDETTGKPVLMRKVSQTSVHAKKLEEEEGEFHKWGTFVQHEHDNDADDVTKQTSTDAPTAVSSATTLTPVAAAGTNTASPSSASPVTPATSAALGAGSTAPPKQMFKFSSIPSGSELREAVIKAKGISSVSDLIGRINKDHSAIDNVYHSPSVEDGMNPLDDYLNHSQTPLQQSPELNAKASPNTSNQQVTANSSPYSQIQGVLHEHLPDHSDNSRSVSQTSLHKTQAHSPAVGAPASPENRKSSLAFFNLHSLQDSLPGNYDRDSKTGSASHSRRMSNASNSNHELEAPSSPISLQSDYQYHEAVDSELELDERGAEDVYEKILDDVVRVRSNKSVN